MLGCVPTSLLLTPAGCSTYEAQCTQAVTQRLCWVPPTAKQQQPQTASQANAVPQNQDPILENMDTLRGTQHCCASRHTHSQIVAHTHTRHSLTPVSCNHHTTLQESPLPRAGGCLALHVTEPTCNTIRAPSLNSRETSTTVRMCGIKQPLIASTSP